MWCTISTISSKMVVFLDLEDDVEPPEQTNHWDCHHGDVRMPMQFGRGGQATSKEVERPNLNRGLGITKALGCYP